MQNVVVLLYDPKFLRQGGFVLVDERAGLQAILVGPKFAVRHLRSKDFVPLTRRFQP